ncbi:MAG TPA: LPS export ABC transporter periplasmic protein LptC [Lentimicrobium sp.]|nr:LPS export ABC transporter periplasmic protein LptC [Lentimicrobium sp.]
MSKGYKNLRECVLILFCVFTALFYTGCKNDMEDVKRLAGRDTIPVMYAKDVSIAESENGHIKYNLTAPVLYRYETKKGATIKFPEGFKVVFFDSINPEKVKTEISAKYGINKETEKIMEAKTDVVVINRLKGEQLNTEHLIWDQNAKKVFSNVFVKITTPDKILYGDGMQSDEAFNHWRIKKPRGEMYVNENQ